MLTERSRRYGREVVQLMPHLPPSIWIGVESARAIVEREKPWREIDDYYGSGRSNGVRVGSARLGPTNEQRQRAQWAYDSRARPADEHRDTPRRSVLFDTAGAYGVALY